MSSRLALVILAVSDLPRSRRFYTEAFHWPVIIDVPVYVEFELPSAMRLGLYDQSAFVRNTAASLAAAAAAGQTSRTELYFFPDDLLQTIETVEKAGGTLLSALANREWGDETAYFADPDGNVLALAREAQPLGRPS